MTLDILRAKNLSACPTVLHFISTRNGGVSSGRFSSLNLAFHVGDEAPRVLENRARLVDALGLSMDDIVVARQVHSANVAIVRSEDKGGGARSVESSVPDVDALVTSDEGVCLWVLVADCAPVLLYDQRRHAIAAIHAGRAGTAKQITSKTLATMAQEFGTSPEDVLVVIGPTITDQHYRISSDNASELRTVLPMGQRSLVARNGEIFFDLARAHIEELTGAGVPLDNIEYTGHSTYGMPELFFSERRDGKPTGRIAAGIMVRAA